MGGLITLPRTNIKSMIGIMLAASIISFFGCSHPQNISDNIASNDEPLYSATQPSGSDNGSYSMNEKFRNSQLNFSTNMFKTIAGSEKGKNILISPVSANIALSMAANGASGNTFSEMQSVLNDGMDIADSNNEFKNYLSYIRDTKELSCANSIWLKNDFRVNQEFVNINKNCFNSDVFNEPFDISTTNKINNWASEKTNGMVDKTINQIDPTAIMYLINALSFDAKWENQYASPKDVSSQIFTSYSNEKKTVEMMVSDEHEYIETKMATGFKKEYDGRKYSFIALLPNKDIDIYDYISSLTQKDIDEIINRKNNLEVKTYLPKFEYDYDSELNDTIKTIGIKDAFGPSSDFSNMTESKTNSGIFISKVLQKTHISVDTEGTKAAAATSVEMSKFAAPVDDSKIVKLDRPFIYMIVDNQNNIPVFIGTIVSM